MTKKRFWWPLQLSLREEEAHNIFIEKILREPIEINKESNFFVIDQLDRLMKMNIADILERDGLPHHCHLINGWGNSTFKGRPLIEGMEVFAHRNANGDYFILQCDPEGDFHPWQSFAYAVMAGVDPDLSLSSKGFTLRSLAKNSRKINTIEGRELGHLLFALSYLEPDIDAHPFLLKDKNYSIKALMDLGVEAHHYGTFDVCRKFHLTEGLCAASASIPGLESYRQAAQGFLDGQMDMLLLLGVILQETRKLQELSKAVEANSLISDIRSTLRLGNLIENHCYYAGHLIELAGFAANFGFSVKTEHWHSMIYIINELNATLPSYLPYLYFQDHFYAVGHYRRAITLLPEIMLALESNRKIGRETLEKFIVNFDSIDVSKDVFDLDTSSKPSSVEQGGIYNISYITKKPREKFTSAIDWYSRNTTGELQARGKFDHFRRIGPSSWPRAFHYEILDYGNEIGVEIHLESDSVLPMREAVKNLEGKIKDLFPNKKVEWDPTWCHDLGRIRVIFDDSYSSEEIAEGISSLIDKTFPELDYLASHLETNPLNRNNLAA